MPVKLDQVLARVASKDAIAHCASLDNERLRVLVTETIKACGLEVSRDGEVYDAAPKPRSLPRQQNTRWRGGRRR